jgi:hypothetical protein
LPNENEAKKIDNDGVEMYLGDEIDQEPNPNDNYDTSIVSVSNYIKDMIDNTTI